MRIVPHHGNFYQVIGLGKLSTSYLNSILPLEKFHDSDKRVWCVHEKHVVSLLQLGYRETGTIEYSKLPEHLYMEVVQKSLHWVRGSPSKKSMVIPKKPEYIDDYATLYLTPNAPHDIVDVVWKALARQYHPDTGGDSETFIKISDAYQRIKRGIDG